MPIDSIDLVARSLSGGRVNVVGLRLPEDDELVPVKLSRADRWRARLRRTLAGVAKATS